MSSAPTTHSTVLDPRQLVRIEAVHRGFLYQHLFAAACLLNAAQAEATRIIVEHDEDIEIELPGRRLYVQVKTRASPLVFSDIKGAIERFDALRSAHGSGERSGTATFVIASSVSLGPELSKQIADKNWPADVKVTWPHGPQTGEAPLPRRPWPNVNDAFVACCDTAATLPFMMTSPETLVWKLAGRIQSAAAGLAPYADHAFAVTELPHLFEQLVVQLEDFPAPPPRYRPQENEPDLVSDQRVRLVVGFSGAGKTSWVSQSALHTTDALVYFNVAEVPSAAITATVARGLAAHLYGRPGGKLGEILLPGATGSQILFLIGKRLESEQTRVTIVIDNAHRVSAVDIRALIDAAPTLHFVLLAQPGQAVALLEATMGIVAEPLRGWTNESVAAEGLFLNCNGDYPTYDRLLRLTGGLPLYAQNALQLAAANYAGSVPRFCGELEKQTHVVSTAQEIILSQIFEGYGDDERRAIAVLSLFDIPISQSEAVRVLSDSCGMSDQSVAALFRKLRTTGTLQSFGVDQVKIHDAMRLLGKAHLETMGPEAARQAHQAVRDMLISQLPEQRSPQRVAVLLRMFVALREVKILVQMATDEIFHELGYIAEIQTFLAELAISPEISAEDRFSALDGLVLNSFKAHSRDEIDGMLTQMEGLVREHNLGDYEKLTVAMKRMNFHAEYGDAAAAQAAAEAVMQAIPDRPDYTRIAKYNYARALNSLGDFQGALAITEELIPEYYGLLGITPEQVVGRNPDKLFPLLNKETDQTDNLKHLADTLDLHAIASGHIGTFSPFARIHAMKFYQMAHALSSFVRVGQDLVDEFVSRADYMGALDVFERNLLPVIIGMKMVTHIVQVRSHYAVVLAYAGRFGEADAEMARLAPYEAGLNDEARSEIRNQRNLIDQLKLVPPKPQWELPQPQRKYPVNAPCYCGSGKKFKKCHGRRAG